MTGARFIPKAYQRAAILWMVRTMRQAPFLDMGLGKTVCVLTSFELLRRARQCRALLVLAPIRVMEDTWPREIAKWSHLRHLRYSIVRGSPISRPIRVGDRLLGETRDAMSKPNAAAAAALAPGFDVYLTNYENLPALCLWMQKQKTLPWDWVVYDESTLMKSPKATRFKRMKPHAFRWPRASILSGTPTPNGYLDLWAQMYLLDGGDALGSNFYNFRDRFFDVNQYTHEVTLKDGAAAVIERKIAPRVLCLRAEDHLSLPPLVENDIPVELPEALRDKYAEMERDLLLQLEAGTVEINDALALSAKCRQFTSGAVYDEAGKVHPLHDLKLDAVADVIEEAAGEPVMVAYEFRSELARLLARWPKADWIGGGSKNPDATIARWNAGKSPLLLVQPQSVSHGLNLQHGPGRIQVWTSGTWVWDRYWQCVKRLHRQGQTRGVRVHRLYCPGTIDEDVLASLREKGGTQAGFLARLAGKVRTRQERSCAKLPSR